MRTIKERAAKRYAEGKLSFNGLVVILGFEEAREIAYYTDVAEASFKLGLSG